MNITVSPSGDVTGATDVANIQTAVTANMASAGEVILAPGRFYINQGINFKGTTGLIFRGSGKNVSYISPVAGVTNMLDCVGSYMLRISDLRLGDGPAQTLTPQSAIYLAQPQEPAPPTGNLIVLRDLWVSGNWSASALMSRGVPCCQVYSCEFWHYTGCPVILSGNTAAGVYPSEFGPVMNAASIVNAFDFFGCELHSENASPCVETNGANGNYFGGSMFTSDATKVSAIPGDTFTSWGTFMSVD